jgi:hypothetical protein
MYRNWWNNSCVHVTVLCGDDVAIHCWMFFFLTRICAVAYPGILFGGEGEGFNKFNWVKPVLLLGCYVRIFHRTGNSAQLCQNLLISGGWTLQTPPPLVRHCTCDISNVNKLTHKYDLAIQSSDERFLQTSVTVSHLWFMYMIKFRHISRSYLRTAFYLLPRLVQMI